MSLNLQPVDLKSVGWTPTAKNDADVTNGVAVDDKALSTPLEQLTTVSLTGSGAFDVLMRATKQHLKEEYDAQRITGQEYSTVYLGALSAVLQTATQFLLNEQQVQKINAEIGLVRQQTVTELSNTDDTLPMGLGFNHVPLSDECIEPIMCDMYGGSGGGGEPA